MENLNKVISSFKLQNELHPKIWYLPNEKFMGDSEGQKYKLNPKVRENLMEIAYQFIDTFGIDVVIEDIIITGSIANFNWSKYSDVDLHILIDYKQFSNELKDLYVEFFDLKKIVFNQKRDVKIFGFDVEVFVEDVDLQGISGGIYSILDDEWIKKPVKEKTKISKQEINKEAKKWMSLIDTLIKNADDEDINTIRDSVRNLKSKIKKFRLSGLKNEGEFGLKNLVFKVLRRNGYINKLYSEPLKKIDKKLSLKETTLGKPLEKMVVTSPFGKIRGGLGSKPHPGVDLGVPSGTQLFAIADGVVKDASIRNDACGGTLKIQHKNGFISRFCHLKKIDVNVGDEVKQGQKLGLTGGAKNDLGSGRSTGAHLHFELYKNGLKVDPMSYIGSSVISQITTKNEPEDTEIIKKIIKKPEYKDVDIKKSFIDKKNSPILNELKKLIISNITFKEGKNLGFENEIIMIQKILKNLGYDDDLKIDGNFNEQTVNVIKRFQQDNNLQPSGQLNKEDFKILYFLVILNNIDQSDLAKNEIEKDDEIINIPDLLFYQEILSGLQLPITDENLKFLYALRNSFDITTKKNNPFNVKDYTGKKLYNGEEIPNFNTMRDGVYSTIETLKLPKFRCLINNMKNQVGALEIADCTILRTLGLQDKITKTLTLEKIFPIKITD